jgi:lipid-A-disaccharide synthase
LTASVTRLLVSCGEPSGDLYAGELVRHLRPHRPGLEVFGPGGDHLLAEGADLLAHVRDMAMVGITEVVRHVRRLHAILDRVVTEVDRRPPDAAVLIDYPDFNLRLARDLRRRDIPIVYYVSPQVWAWKRGRLKTIRETVARMLVIFPFEEPLYRDAGVPVRFVGHPLVDLVHPAPDRAAFLACLGLDAERTVVALLPGSRVPEVEHNLPPLVEASVRIRRERPDLQFLLAIASSLDAAWVAGKLAGTSIVPVVGQTHAVVGASALALVASGTATVETALLGTPMVVVYRLSALTYALGRPFVRVPHFAMVNLIADRRIVPELIQRDFTAERVAIEALDLLNDPSRTRAMKEDLALVRRRLGEPGASERAGREVLQILTDSQAKKLDMKQASM